MGAEDGRSPETDAYGWPQDESSPPSSAAEVKIVSSILPEIELRGLELTPLATGQEHFVYTSTLPKRVDQVIKVTRPGGYGLIMEAKPGDRVIGWRRATIREYLQRVRRQNRVLDDTAEVLGTTLQRNEHGATVPGIVTAQPFRSGTPPPQDEIHAYMQALGFSHVPGRMISLKYLSGFSFYSGAHNLLVSDCRSANFVKTASGLDVIDVIVQRPAGQLRQLLRQSLGLRLDGEQFKKQLDQIIEKSAPGRNRSIQAAKLVEDLGGPPDTLTKLRVAAVHYVRGEANHSLDARIEAHAEAAFSQPI